MSSGARRVHPVLLLVATGLGLFMIFLDATIVNVALPAIQHDFSVGESGLRWVVAAYSLTMGMFMMTSASIADRCGRRRKPGAVPRRDRHPGVRARRGPGARIQLPGHPGSADRVRGGPGRLRCFRAAQPRPDDGRAGVRQHPLHGVDHHRVLGAVPRLRHPARARSNDPPRSTRSCKTPTRRPSLP